MRNKDYSILMCTCSDICSLNINIYSSTEKLSQWSSDHNTNRLYVIIIYMFCLRQHFLYDSHHLKKVKLQLPVLCRFNCRKEKLNENAAFLQVLGLFLLQSRSLVPDRMKRIPPLRTILALTCSGVLPSLVHLSPSTETMMEVRPKSRDRIIRALQVCRWAAKHHYR